MKLILDTHRRAHCIVARPWHHRDLFDRRSNPRCSLLWHSSEHLFQAELFPYVLHERIVQFLVARHGLTRTCPRIAIRVVPTSVADEPTALPLDLLLELGALQRLISSTLYESGTSSRSIMR